MFCADGKILEGIHIEPEMSCTDKSSEDTHDVFIMSSVDNAIEDTHVVSEKVLKYSYVVLEKRINEVEKMAKNERQMESQFHSKRKIINPEMIRRRKIFVGGLPSGISEEEFKEYFERFGTITDVVVMRDNVTNRPRGFGFITFGSEKSVNDVMVNSFYDLNGKQVEVKRVMPKVENRDRGVFDQLKYINGNGTSWEGFPYYGTNNMIPSLAYGSHPWYNNNTYGSHPWYNNNGLYANAPNPYDWYPMLGASLPWYMSMAPMAQPCPDPYCFPSYPYVGGNVGVNNKPTQNNHIE